MFSAVKNFIIIFCVSVLIFGLLAALIVPMVLDAAGISDAGNTPDDSGNAIETETSDPSISGTQDPPNTDSSGGVIDPPSIGGSSFNMLLIGTDYQPDIFHDYDFTEANKEVDGFPLVERKISADMIIFIRVDKEKGEYVFSQIPSNMRVTDKGIYKPLSAIYDDSGLDYFLSKITALTSLPIDYSVVVSVDGLKEIIDGLGGITYYVPKNMEYEDPAQNLKIELKRGSQTLSGEQALMLLRYTSDPLGSERREIATSFLRVVLSKFTDKEYYSKIPDYWKMASDHIETNFTEQDMADRLDMFFAYADFKQVDIIYPGSSLVHEGVTYFEPNISKAWELFGEYKFNG